MSERELGSLTGLWRYPVSSLGGEALERIHCGATGLAQDRKLAVFEAQTLETANPSRKRWRDVPRAFSRSLDGVVQVSIDRERWHLCDDPVLVDQLSSLYGTRVQILPYGLELGEKRTEHRYPLAPLHLVSQQSMDMLKRLLPDSQIDARRFRPNVIVDLPGLDPHTPSEHQLIGKEFYLGGVKLRGTLKTGRCSFTTLEQFDLPEDRDVLKTLIAHFGKDFGIYCDVVEEGALAVHDALVLPLVARHKSRIGIVGAGQAGATAAKALRELGHTGPITLFGDEPHAPYERPPLSKAFEVGAARSDISTTSVLDGMAAEALDIGLRLQSPVVHIDRTLRHLETADGQQHPYDYLILATGGAARRLPLVDRGHHRVHSIRTLADAQALQSALQGVDKVFVAGGGWLGLEIASALRSNNIQVSLFARQQHLCSRVLPVEVSDYLAQLHRSKGVDLRLGEMPTFIESADRVVAHYAAGAEETAQLLIVAIGMQANDWLARHAGLTCQSGVVTDVAGATSDPFIYAIGDVAVQQSPSCPQGLRLESWHNAIEQAGRAARSILDLAPVPVATPRFWSEQYGLNLQVAGSPDPQAVAVQVEHGQQPLWRYDGFVVGVDRPKEVHQFAQQLQSSGLIATAVEPPVTTGPSEAADIRHCLGDSEPLASGQFKTVDVRDIGALLIANVEGIHYAIQEQCPHADAPLSEGFLEGNRIVCPLHFAAFDLDTGTAHQAPSGCSRAKTYKAEYADGCLYVWLPK